MFLKKYLKIYIKNKRKKMNYKLLQGDALEKLKLLPDNSVHWD